ncbi:hypothetical protein [Sulfuricaulis sp.]|jgi:hypothetical protein|uniref:hypothetical protein n=1 Tax=Sulfuricaulis sp. TaxID=2003553 RepID=UPI00355AC537
MKKSFISVALTLILGTAAVTSHAAVLNTGDLLAIAPGVVDHYDSYGNAVGVASGSWFGADTNGNGALSEYERQVTTPGSAGGLIVGATQAPGEIEHSYFFGGDTRLYTVTAPTSGDGTLNLSGLRWSWLTDWTFGSGAWTPTNTADFGAPGSGYANGVAQLQWSGVYGDSYNLWYATTEPVGSPTGCGGCRFFWHLTGTVQAAPTVPIPAAVWLFGSGILSLTGFSFRKRSL